MHPLRKKIAQFKAVKTFSSVKIAVACLMLLFILTFWGTVDQVENGLFHSQEKFFNSFFFLIFGFIPFPGAQLVLWVLFFNLACVSISRFVFRWSNIGILIIHFGLLTYFVSAFVTLHCVQESNLMLKEGEASNVGSSYKEWELSAWTQKEEKKDVVAFDAKDFSEGKTLDFSEYGFTAQVQFFYPNSEAYTFSKETGQKVYSASGIQALKEVGTNKEPEKNIPGGKFLVKTGKEELAVILFGAEVKPAVIKTDSGNIKLMLRRKRYPLPVLLKLRDFVMEVHPNTDTARSYKSEVTITAKDFSRDVTISMNRPLRFKNYTFYQASYSIDAQGREFSTLAVVRNSGRVLPYVASLVTFLGLVTHFLMMAFRTKLK